jgi:AcrR family transcriptional regulator
MDMTSSSVRRIDEIGEESRRRILDAAEELFAEKASTRPRSSTSLPASMPTGIEAARCSPG